MPNAMMLRKMITILIAPRPVLSPGDVSSPSNNPLSQKMTTHSFQKGKREVLPKMG